jgi:heme oxygenase
MTNRFALKAATDDIHRELDRRLSRLDLAEPSDYRRFLSFHARTVPPLEKALAGAGASTLLTGWDKSRRASAIRTDLEALGEAMPAPVAVPPIKNAAQLLGTAYVVEGSRLGGRVLRQRVGEGLPASFLNQSEARYPWPTLVAALDRLLCSDALVGEAKDAARRCFTLFLNVAREAGI